MDGLRLWYETAGEAGTPVLLVMGMGLPGAGWAPLLPALCGRHRVATYDHRGIGRSDKPRGPYRVEILAADALALLTHLGWERAHVVGISLGGLVAQEIALTARARVRSLALVSTAAGGGLTWWPTRQSMVLMPQVLFARGPRQLYALQRQLLSKQFLAGLDREVVAREMRARLGPRSPSRSSLAQFLGFLLYRSRSRLPRLAGLPTLVVHGSEDIILPPRLGRRLAAAIPGARLLIIPGVAHGLILERPQEVGRLLLEHFQAADAAAAGSAAGTAPSQAAAGPV
jgi:pimeloyl-ACP methyl ester carboxylesterase